MLFVIVIALFVIGSISSTVHSGVTSNAFPYDTPYAVFVDNNGNAIGKAMAEATVTPALLLGSLTVPRVGHSAQLLPDDRVLIAGGWSASTIVASSEIFDPTTRRFSPTGDMTEARANFTTSPTGDGRVLVIGGLGIDGKALASAEVFDPQTDQFAATGAPGSARMNHTATVLTDGKVLVVGGSDGTADLPTAELYDPATAQFTSTGWLHIARQGHTATLLDDGRVLVAGGKNQYSAEIYDPRTGKFELAGRMSSVHENAGAVLLLDGRVMIAGGSDGS
ncbi:MAG TPA: kelch repeat-containing protein, partial [Candidatus Limnocylindrales bacterium]